MKNKGVRVLILDIPTTLIDYSSLDNKIAEFMMEMINNLLIEVYAATAEMEMDKREKRQREGYEALRARGEWDKLGRPAKYDKEAFLSAYREAKEKGISDKKTAEKMEISYSTLKNYKRRYIKREDYKETNKIADEN